MLGLALYLFIFISALRFQVAKHFSVDDDPFGGFELAKLFEAQRRLRMLGDTVEGDFNKHRLRTRARDIFVHPNEVEKWWRAYHEGGLDALKPQWSELSKISSDIVAERYGLLGVYADQEYLDSDDIQSLAEINKWHFSTAWRWLRRYRTLGLYGLAPEKNPFKWKRLSKQDKRRSALGAIGDDDLRETYRRYDTIKPLTEKRHVTQAEVEARAADVGESVRTLRYRLAAYRENGMAGLIPQERVDKGHVHGISPRVERMIRGIRLSIPNATFATVREEAQRRAKDLGEKEPSSWQVRFVIAQIPEPLLLLADRRDREFRNKYRLTYRIRFEGVIWQIDQTPVDTLAVDIRRPKYQTSKKEKRCFLTGVLECNSRRVLAARFGYDQANRFNVAAVLRDAILVGGIPDEIWTDRGAEFTSSHVAELLKEFHIHLEITSHAELKGRIERIFRTFNEQHWVEQPGYVGSHTGQRNPNNRPKLTVAELEKGFWKYINEKYHCRPHSELPYKDTAEPDGPSVRMSPLEYWNEFCFAEHIDPRRLDVFLKNATTHTIGKGGIKHDNRKYWHDIFGESEVMGENVTVRTAPYYEGPDEIEVFLGNDWLCTAFAYESERGEAVKPGDVADAQRNQRRSIRHGINEARQDLRDADREIAKLGNNQPRQEVNEPAKPKKSTTAPSANVSQAQKKPAKRKGGFIDRMVDDSEVL